MKLGSLFDGSGTAPLAAAMVGFKPVWASEIELYPIKVTKARFPNMKHLGSITDINGAEVEPVDIICGGSPCQDLSVAGKQKGLHEGERSHLFFEMTRIIKEMRDATNGQYPRYIIWENVPGAFSSNKGRDFLAVLKAFAQIADPDIYVPEPKQKAHGSGLAWKSAGYVAGDGWSIAWRTVDAQYWGVPQRRRRIYLVADFGGERADEILFEPEGVSGNFEPGRAPREETARVAAECFGGSSGVKCLNPWGSQTIRQYDASGIYPAITSNATGGQNRQGVIYPTICLEGNGQRPSHQGDGYRSGDVQYTLNSTERHGVIYDITDVNSNSMKSPNPYSCFKQRDVTRTLDSFVGTPDCNQGGNVVVKSIDCRNMILNNELSCTLQAKGNGGYSLNYQNPIMYPFDMQAFGKYGDGTTANSLKQRDYKDATDLIVGDCRVYPGVGITSLQNASNPQPGDPAPTLSTDSRNYLVKNSDPPRRYIVRRLTPLECCRLQGFPDWWEEGVEGSDSARYKMWGNGMALPNMLHVMRRLAIAEELRGGA